jgi:hypothetical protein
VPSTPTALNIAVDEPHFALRHGIAIGIDNPAAERNQAGHLQVDADRIPTLADRIGLRRNTGAGTEPVFSNRTAVTAGLHPENTEIAGRVGGRFGKTPWVRM